MNLRTAITHLPRRPLQCSIHVKGSGAGFQQHGITQRTRLGALRCTQLRHAQHPATKWNGMVSCAQPALHAVGARAVQRRGGWYGWLPWHGIESRDVATDRCKELLCSICTTHAGAPAELAWFPARLMHLGPDPKASLPAALESKDRHWRFQPTPSYRSQNWRISCNVPGTINIAVVQKKSVPVPAP